MPQYTATITCDWKLINSQTNELLYGWCQQTETSPLIVTYPDGELVLTDGRPNQASASNYIAGIHLVLAKFIHDRCRRDEVLNKEIAQHPTKFVLNNINLIKIE